MTRQLTDEDGDFLKEKVLLESDHIASQDIRTTLLLSAPWTTGKVRYLYSTLDFIARTKQPN